MYLRYNDRVADEFETSMSADEAEQALEDSEDVPRGVKNSAEFTEEEDDEPRGGYPRPLRLFIQSELEG